MSPRAIKKALAGQKWHGPRLGHPFDRGLPDYIGETVFCNVKLTKFI